MTDTPQPTPADNLVDQAKRIIYGATFGARGAELHEDKIDRAARAVLALVIDQVSDLTFLIPLIEKQSEGEWPDNLIASDARMLSDAIRALKKGPDHD